MIESYSFLYGIAGSPLRTYVVGLTNADVAAHMDNVKDGERKHGRSSISAHTPDGTVTITAGTHVYKWVRDSQSSDGPSFAPGTVE